MGRDWRFWAGSTQATHTSTAESPCNAIAHQTKPNARDAKLGIAPPHIKCSGTWYPNPLPIGLEHAPNAC